MILNVHASYPHTLTYVLKLHRDAAPREGRILGRLEHVDSGHQFHFNSVEELVACLIAGTAFTEATTREEGLP